MKVPQGVEIKLHAFLILAIDVDKLSASLLADNLRGNNLKCPLEGTLLATESQSTSCENKRLIVFCRDSLVVQTVS
jgi:hypothetical protein